MANGGWNRSRTVAVLAVLLAVAGLVLLGVGILGVATAATPNMRGFNPGQSLVVPGSGMSVYARSDAVRSDAVCVASQGGSETVLERPVAPFPVDVSGTPFYEVARSPADMDAGVYEVTCHDTDEPVYAGPRVTETVVPGVVGDLGLLLGGIALLAALASGLLWLVVQGRDPQA